MEWIICPAEGCGKKIKSLKSHYRSSHPDLDVPDMRDLKPVLKPEPVVQITEEEAKTEESSIEQTKQSDSMEEKLRMLGVDSAQVDAFFESCVIKVLEKMQLGEAINKRFGEVEAKLSQEIKTTLEKLQTVTTQPSGDNQPQNTQLRDTILATLAQKLIGGGSSDSGMEQITKVLNLAQAVSDAVNNPRMEERVATRREISETLKMLRDAGASPEDARDTTIRSLDQK